MNSDLVGRLNEMANADCERLSDSLRTTIDDLCKEFADGSPKARSVTLELSRAAHQALLTYAWRCAEDAVRKHSKDYVINGLAALIIEGGHLDIRDTVVELAILRHSATLLCIDADHVIEEFVSLSGNTPLTERLRKFPISRESQNLKHYYMRAVGAGNTFHYVLGESWTDRKWWKFWRW
jgi:hypothetical protein